jgi:hypothetical protein
MSFDMGKMSVSYNTIMTYFIVVLLAYTIVWLNGMYFILHRIYVINKRTEERVYSFDKTFLVDGYRYSWTATIFLGIVTYILSILIITLFLRP